MIYCLFSVAKFFFCSFFFTYFVAVIVTRHFSSIFQHLSQIELTLVSKCSIFAPFFWLTVVHEKGVGGTLGTSVLIWDSRKGLTGISRDCFTGVSQVTMKILPAAILLVLRWELSAFLLWRKISLENLRLFWTKFWDKYFGHDFKSIFYAIFLGEGQL